MPKNHDEGLSDVDKHRVPQAMKLGKLLSSRDELMGSRYASFVILEVMQQSREWLIAGLPLSRRRARACHPWAGVANDPSKRIEQIKCGERILSEDAEDANERSIMQTLPASSSE